MQTPTHTTPRRRITLLPVQHHAQADRPVIRRYRLARVVDDLGTLLAPARPATPGAPAQGVRAP